jgi:hypothetical protein
VSVVTRKSRFRQKMAAKPATESRTAQFSRRFHAGRTACSRFSTIPLHRERPPRAARQEKMVMSTLEDSVVTRPVLPSGRASSRPAGTRILAALRRIGTAVVAARRRHAMLQVLHGLDDRMLRDIGLMRGEIGSGVRDLPARWR